MELASTFADLTLESLALQHTKVLALLQSVWMILTFAVMQVAGVFTLEQYFVVSYFGLVALAFVMAPEDTKGTDWRAVTWAIRIGFLVLAYFVVVRGAEFVTI